MPEVGDWIPGRRVRVVGELDTSQYKTDDPPPAIGAVGEITAVNTRNGEVRSVGVMFEKRGWVMPVTYVELLPKQDVDYGNAQVVRIDSTWDYLWIGELRLVPGDTVVLPSGQDSGRYWHGKVTEVDVQPHTDQELKFVLGLAP